MKRPRQLGLAGFIAIYKKGFVQPAYMSDLPADRFARYTRLAEQVADPAYEDGIAKVYRVRPSDPLKDTYIQLGPDWHQVEESYGRPFRWMDGPAADLCVFSPGPRKDKLTFRVASFGMSRHLQVWVGDRQALSIEVPADGALHEVSVPGVEWPSEAQRVRLVSEEASVSPQSLGRGTDKRQLSLGFADIRLGSSP